jgi:hypothetical protein
MLRVVLGRVRPDAEWSGKISALRFNSASAVQENAGSNDPISTIVIARSDAGEEADLEANPKPRAETLDYEEGKGGTNEEKARIRYA